MQLYKQATNKSSTDPLNRAGSLDGATTTTVGVPNRITLDRMVFATLFASPLWLIFAYY